MISCCSCKLQRLALCGRDLASTRRHITIQQASPSASGLFKNLNVKRSTITRATASNSADVERWPVSIVEVGPRDGLQNEPSAVVPTDIKVSSLNCLMRSPVQAPYLCCCRSLCSWNRIIYIYFWKELGQVAVRVKSTFTYSYRVGRAIREGVQPSALLLAHPATTSVIPSSTPARAKFDIRPVAS